MSASSIHAEPPPEIVRDAEGIQYETGAQLGKGGFAICHRAKLTGRPYLKEQRTVALKIVRSKMEPPKLAQKFVTELQIHSKLSHPNIVEFYRAFSFEESTYVVLELCENGSLADAIKKRKYFTMPEIRRFMIQTCGAIKYLHQRNIVHRDLKTGNLFLDHNMDVKVGDFGLAALLLSPGDYGAIRRTTMCGTPNYLAPEVLEKTGKGHDEKVDLWAIGIMMYTLAVGRAPFHAAKREDIYRKLKARDYNWPDLAKFANEITDDLRDIVSLLLVHEDERPTPDQIVAHPFFKLGYIPLQLESGCTSRVPKWPKNRPPTASTIKRGYTEEWWTMCKASAVGEYEQGKSFGAYGTRRNKTVARDCQKEIEAGKAPSIPFVNCVYLPFPARSCWLQQAGGLTEISEEKESSVEVEAQALVETTGNDRPKGRLPRITKKEMPAPKTVKETKEPVARKEPLPAVKEVQQKKELKENVEPVKEPEVATRILDKQPTRRREPLPAAQELEEKKVLKENVEPVKEPEVATRILDKQPTRLRAVRKISNPGRVTAATAVAPAPLRVPRESRTTTRARMTKEIVKEAPKATETGLPDLPPLRIVKTNSRTVEQPELVPEQATTRKAPRFRAISAEMPATDPVSVLARLHVFRDNLARALDKKPTKSRRDQPPRLPFISKWVDYSRRYGVGYVMDDGSIGVLLSAEDHYPVTVAFARDGYTHLRKAGKDRDIAKSINLDYYTTLKKDRGLTRIEMLDKRRIEEIRTVWHKFGWYMCSTLSEEEVPMRKEPHMNVVKFYQRLGNVGVWGFEDGSFQFNFPDHTKLVLSSEAGYCKFLCLPSEATAKLEDGGDVAWKFIRERATLQASLQQLLYGSADKKDSYKELTERNHLRAKIEFIYELVAGWCQQGGLGCLKEPKDHSWGGPRLDEGKRMDWASVGRYGGDIFS